MRPIDQERTSSLEPPPAYAIIDQVEYASTSTIEPTTNVSRENCGREYELRHNSNIKSGGLQVYHNDNILYYAAHYSANDRHDSVLYAGYDSMGPQLALGQFIPFNKDFKIYVGGLKNPVGDDWDTVRCAEGSLFSNPMHRFEVSTTATSGASAKQKFYWKRTSDSKLGASHFSSRDHKLVDESSDEVVAVYIESKSGARTVKGTIRFKQVLSPLAEIKALVVLLALLEKSRRYMRSVANAFPNTNGW